MEFSINITANMVAWYAAIVSTLGVIVAVLNYLGDKRRLKLSASHGILTGMGDDSTKVIFSAANTGKRPVTISGVGLSFVEKNDLVLVRTPNLKLPSTLKEGQSCSTWMDHAELEHLLKREKKTVKDIKYVWFRDSTGKRYRRKYKLKW
jgi:hypothetical protein